MREPAARTIVHTLAWLVWLLTAIIAYQTLWTLWQYRFFTPEGIAIYRGTPIVTGIFLLLLVLTFGIAVGYGLWKKRTWARILGIIFCVLVILDIITFVFYNPLSWSLLISVILAGMGIWALAFNKEIRALFH